MRQRMDGSAEHGILRALIFAVVYGEKFSLTTKTQYGILGSSKTVSQVYHRNTVPGGWELLLIVQKMQTSE